MVKQINISEFTQALNEAHHTAMAGTYKIYEECEQALLNNTDPTATRKLLRQYEWAKMDNERADKFDIDKRIKAAELFNLMAREISMEFGDTEVDTDNFTISFGWFGNTISWPVKMLAAKYNLHSCGFGFDSSFTNHEAVTEDNYHIHIGRGTESGIIMVNFGNLNKVKF